GIKHIDKLMISHQDNDHSGGLQPLLDLFTVDQLLLPDTLLAQWEGSRKKSDSATKATLCDSDIHWFWGQAKFTVLHPSPVFNKRVGFAKKSNNQSCVVRIEVAGISILLTGDIEREVEALLLQQGIEAADILLLPHHGSRTSSSVAFVQQIDPQYGLLSAGFLNRYHHPHQHVLSRYQQLGVKIINTAEVGAIHLNVFADGQISIKTASENNLFYH
ncbi:MAG: MBL fold metallo-hydrolase, partial [Pseudomonadales bacterium]|nr:MBL fold metallo-hydrolase [Pseudomonadales bacterium]